jgi:multidrug efflux pump subunit AcrB
MMRKQRVVLGGLVALLAATGCESDPGSRARRPGPTIVVEASYPGANAQVVADTVAAPIEEQVNGVTNMLSMTSRSWNDGTYTLTVTFKHGTNPDRAQVLVQNRADLALPVLPDAVKRTGLTIRKKSPSILLMLALSSSADRFDPLTLSNYSNTTIKEELVRVEGVADVVLVGERDPSLRIWLDPQKLASRNLSPVDVVGVLKKEKIKVRDNDKSTGKAKGFPSPLSTAWPPADLEAVEHLILKADDNGPTIRLKDVARVQVGGDPPGRARYNGKPCVVLCIYPRSQTRVRDLSAALARRLEQLRARMPEGLRLETAFDFGKNWTAVDSKAAPENLVLDVTLPGSASLARTENVLSRCRKILRHEPDVKEVLELCGPPLAPGTNQGTLVVRLAPADQRQAGREGIKQHFRSRVEKEIPDVAVRVRDLGGFGRCPLGSYPIELTVHGPEPDQVRKLADKLVERLRRSKKLRDVSVCREALLSPQPYLDVDRTKASELGVATQDVFEVLQIHLGSYHVKDINRFGRTWEVVVQVEPQLRQRPEDLTGLKVRNSKGEMVRLGAFVTVRTVEGPRVVDRYNLEPMVQVTANPVAGVSEAQARTLCATLADEVRRDMQLPAAYQVSWLGPN